MNTATEKEVLRDTRPPEPFSHHKLRSSLEHTCLPADLCHSIAEEVTETLKGHSRISSDEIFARTERKVREKSRLAATQYSLKRAIFDLGPEGHNFEVFVSKYFRQLGYETLECVTFQGLHVKHEVDVVAVKGKEKLFVECKFHNHLGIKNDIKVALYVKARWDDLKAGPDGKSLSGFCLASNTSFTTDALTYGNGTKLRLMGVNAPNQRSFFDDLKELKLYPVTSLSSASKPVKKEAIARKLVLARDLLGEENFLQKLGCTPEEIKNICDEICFLTKESNCEDHVLGRH